MHFVVDGTPAINDVRAIKRYAFELLSEMSSFADAEQLTYLYLFDKKSSAPKPDTGDVKTISSSVPGKLLQPLWKYLKFPSLSNFVKGKTDLIHFTGGNSYLPSDCKVKLATIHGISFLRHPELFDNEHQKQLEKTLKFTVDECTNFITVCEYGKKELMKFCGVSEDRITAIPLGVSDAFFIEELGSKYKSDEKLLVYSGALEEHKDIKTLIDTVQLLGDGYKLVLAGQKTVYLDSLALPKNVITPGYLNDQQLRQLYNEADIFVSSTHYENWCSPPLEAMRCGTPVIVSDIEPLRESTGGNAIFVEQGNPEGFAKNIKALIENNERYKDLSDKGKKFADGCNWRTCAERTLALYRQLCG